MEQDVVKPLMVSIEAGAQLLDLVPSTMAMFVRTQRIHAVKIGRTWRIPYAEIERVVREGIPDG